MHRHCAFTFRSLCIVFISKSNWHRASGCHRAFTFHSLCIDFISKSNSTQGKWLPSWPSTVHSLFVHFALFLQDNHKKIFSIFKKLHSNEKYDGNGLGLTICQKIIEKHGGSISVESNQSGGINMNFSIKKSDSLFWQHKENSYCHKSYKDIPYKSGL